MDADLNQMLWLDDYIRPRRRFAPSRFGQARNLASFVFAFMALVGYVLSLWGLSKTGISSTPVFFGLLIFWFSLGLLGYFVFGERPPRAGESWGSFLDLLVSRLGVGFQDSNSGRVRYFFGHVEVHRPPDREIQMIPAAVLLREPLAEGESPKALDIAGA